MQLYFALLFTLLYFTDAIQNNSYFQLRNSLLRVALLKKNNNIILIKEKIKQFYDFYMIKINEFNIEYYKIPEDERYIIETIIGLNL
jgi:hypothetical protein